MDKDSKQVVVLLTHPNIKESRANKALMWLPVKYKLVFVGDGKLEDDVKKYCHS